MRNKFLAIFLIISIVSFGNMRHINVEADYATTSVEVGNTTPTFDTGYEPHEDPASATSTPTNVGDNVTFKGKATDANGDNWKLLICSTNSVTGTSCSATTYCTSGFASSSVEASCNYQAQEGDTETMDWYGFACDAVGCSTESHKTDDSGPPFHVNHRPSFTVFSDDSPKDPNTTVTWTTTASDADAGGSDYVQLYVCKTNSFSTSSGCLGGEWCHATSTSNPTCNTTTPRPDGNYDAYGFVMDNHSFASTDTAQGTNSTMTVNNVAPSLTAGDIYLKDTDGSGNLQLNTENGETNGFIVTFIVTDNNSCQNISSTDEITSALINVRMSEILQANCTASGDYNANNCYPDAYASWNPVCAASSTVNGCTGNTDTDVGWACTFPLQYHADPTVAGTPKASYHWVVSVQATDDDAATSALTDGSNTNELETYMAYDLATTTLAYGSVPADTDSNEKTTDIKATGNVALDETLQGTDMCTDYPTCGGNVILANQQHYAATSSLGWASMIALSSTTADELEINCPKTTITNTPATSSTYWVLRVPSGQATGTYTGQNTIIGKTDESYGGS